MTTETSSKTKMAQLSKPAPPPKLGRKSDEIVKRLKRKKGVSLRAFSEEFDWLPHTTRAALSRLRKSGHKIERTTGPKGSI
ncbi:DUF3489 domain-containing protein [Roseovarius phycicola]|uniref:DUF3489 domain-containing protein n=1 Tax=Roseovarius phycicola TaxID=3080976 RepID=A0ABZ2HHC4_9RHOB